MPSISSFRVPNIQQITNNTLTSGPLASLESPVNTQINGNNIQFPSDELIDIDHWVTFRAFKTTQLDRTAVPTKEYVSSISLPIPGNLATAYTQDYAEQNLYGLDNIIADAFADHPQDSSIIGTEQALFKVGAGTALGTLGGPLGAMIGAAAGVASTTQSELRATAQTAASIANGIASRYVAQSGPLGQAIAANRGIAVNPHKVVLYDSPKFRSHQFSYQFTPKSFEEAQTLKNIIKLFKKSSSPKYAGQTALTPNFGPNSQITADLTAGRHFFNYPDSFEIEFHHPEFLFNIVPSVLTNITVDYAPMGVPTFARGPSGTPTPTQINISLNFMETSILTADEIESGA